MTKIASQYKVHVGLHQVMCVVKPTSIHYIFMVEKRPLRYNVYSYIYLISAASAEVKGRRRIRLSKC